MHRLRFIAFALLISLAAARNAHADDLCDCEAPTLDEIKAAATKSIALLESSAVVYRKERECFGCHHQAMPVLALTEARRRGFKIDEANYAEQLKRTAEHLKRGEESYRQGTGQGGRADTAGWALWTLETGGWKPDDTTALVAGYLLDRQNDLDFWRTSGNRPPTEASNFSTTYVAVRGLSSFGSGEQEQKISDRKERALKWLESAEPADTEDRVFRLRALSYLAADEEVTKSAAADLKKHQREDGGWSQLADLESDAYGTATALAALHEYGDLPVTDDVYQRGLAYLMKSQLADGSWHVKTRSKPIQKYFESGFPHEKDQFISIAATSWATLALAYACPEPALEAVEENPVGVGRDN
jgi:N-acyl-D-amino-acid deacylase